MQRIGFLLIILSLGLCFSFLTGSKEANQIPLESFKKEFSKDYNNYLKSLKSFKSSLENNSGISDSYFDLRDNFKSVEFIMAHFDSEIHKLFINGAPLPTIAVSDNEAKANDPEGIQVIDEFIGENNFHQDAKEIIQKLEKVIVQSRSFIGVLKNSNITDRLILEAIRKDLLRVMTLSITGFDTPGTVNALTDAINSLETQKKYLQPYILLSGEFEEITPLYDGAIKFIKENNDFGSFDRLKFLTDFFNPLFKKILALHKRLQIETIGEVTPVSQAWNYNEPELFSENFLNKYNSTTQRPQFNKDEIRDLGRALFYDPILSSNNKRACSSCHNPKKAFTDGESKSIGLDFVGTVDRNAMVLIDCAYTDGYFYDLRASNLESQFEHVFSNPKEFNTTWKEIIAKLNKSEEYRTLFANSFADSYDDHINPHTIQIALTQFVVSLTSFNSEFDKYVRGEIASVSDEVREGFNIFMGKGACGTCHFAPAFNGLVPPNFTDMESEVLGVPEKIDGKLVLDDDPGRIQGRIKEGVDFYLRSFKTVTVRNAELTSPYMHNGVYSTLEEVMEFYNEGGGVGLGFEVPNQTLPFDSLSLSQKEINSVIEFMKALTDTTGLTSIPVRLPKFSDAELNKRPIGGEY